MLRVPDLKPGEQPFDPDFAQIMNPWMEKPEHTLRVGTSAWAGEAEGRGELKPEERVEVMLNLAVVKEAVTKLHRDEDAFFRELETVSSARICDIVAEHEKFMLGKMAEGENACRNEDQKALFRKTTGSFFAQSRGRALALRYRLAEKYWREAVEGQNNEFLARALRAENLTDDRALTMYRDLIFYNIENMLAGFPEGERREKLDAAGGAFYRKVVEKRLECDPAGAKAMTGEKEVRRVLGAEECAALAEKADAAVRERELDAVAGAWVKEGKTPDDAERAARMECGEEKEREYILRKYRQMRFADNREIVFALMANMADAWERLKEGDFDENAMPPWIAANDPALAECLRECLRKRENAGGGEPDPDYPRVMAFLNRFERDGLWEVMEYLRDGEACLSLLLAAGGPESEMWLLCIRLLGGLLTEADAELVAALRLAWGEARENGFMIRFAKELSGEEDKRPLAVLECVGKVEESFSKVEENNEE